MTDKHLEENRIQHISTMDKIDSQFLFICIYELFFSFFPFLSKFFGQFSTLHFTPSLHFSSVGSNNLTLMQHFIVSILAQLSPHSDLITNLECIEQW